MIDKDDLTEAQRDPAVARELLASLRWDADQKVVNPFGEYVWLKPHLDENGVRRGITDCCPVSDPCERHAAMETPPQ